MRIVVEENRISGFVDYNSSGRETEVVVLYVDGDSIKVGSSMCLPVRFNEAALVLGCINQTFIDAENLFNTKKVNK